MGQNLQKQQRPPETGFSAEEQKQFSLSARKALKETAQTPATPRFQKTGEHRTRLEPESKESLVDILKKENFPLQAESTNFKVHAAHASMAKLVLAELEKSRKSTAVALVGHELEDWSTPCEVYVAQGRQDSGATVFYPRILSDQEREEFRNSVTPENLEQRFRELKEPRKVEMAISGPNLASIRENVVPHEVAHTITRTVLEATPPRWADEGIASYREGSSMKTTIRGNLMRAFAEGRNIPLPRVFDTLEYPENPQANWNFYCHGMALSEFLIRQDGMRPFVAMLKDVSDRQIQNIDTPHSEILEGAIRDKYGFKDLGELNDRFSLWVRDGCPRIVLDAGAEKSSLPSRYLSEKK